MNPEMLAQNTKVHARNSEVLVLGPRGAFMDPKVLAETQDACMDPNVLAKTPRCMHGT